MKFMIWLVEDFVSFAMFPGRRSARKSSETLSWLRSIWYARENHVCTPDNLTRPTWVKFDFILYAVPKELLKFEVRVAFLSCTTPGLIFQTFPSSGDGICEPNAPWSWHAKTSRFTRKSFAAMCVIMHWNPFPLLFLILLTAIVLTALLLGLLAICAFKARAKEKTTERKRPAKLSRRSGITGTAILLSPMYSAYNMIARTAVPVYLACRRTLHSAASVIRWKTPEKSTLDHEQLIHDSRWQTFCKERVLPASSETFQGIIPLEHFPLVRQSQLGTLVAYSVDYVRNMFTRDEGEESVAVPRERHVLLLRGPKTRSEGETEPLFKDVVTDMLQLKQVCGDFFVQLSSLIWPDV